MSKLVWITLGTMAATGGAIAGASYVYRRQHGAVADMAVFLDHGIGTGETVHHAGILQVGAGFQDQPAEIAAQAGTGADIAARADDHVADQHGAGVNIGRRIDDRNDAVDGINTQGSHAGLISNGHPIL